MTQQVAQYSAPQGQQQTGNNLISSLSNMPAELAKLLPENDGLADKIAGGLGGRKFSRIVVSPRVLQYADENGNMLTPPAMYTDVILLNASQNVERQWYAKDFNEGDSGAAPDCFSRDGKTPDRRADMARRPKVTIQPCAEYPNGGVRPVMSCAECPMNCKDIKGKTPCQFFKRAVVKPVENLAGPAYALKIPSMSLFGKGEGNALTFSQLPARVAEVCRIVGKKLPVELMQIRIHMLQRDQRAMRFTIDGILPYDLWQLALEQRNDPDVKDIIDDGGDVGEHNSHTALPSPSSHDGGAVASAPAQNPADAPYSQQQPAQGQQFQQQPAQGQQFQQQPAQGQQFQQQPAQGQQFQQQPAQGQQFQQQPAQGQQFQQQPVQGQQFQQQPAQGQQFQQQPVQGQQFQQQPAQGQQFQQQPAQGQQFQQQPAQGQQFQQQPVQGQQFQQQPVQGQQFQQQPVQGQQFQQQPAQGQQFQQQPAQGLTPPPPPPPPGAPAAAPQGMATGVVGVNAIADQLIGDLPDFDA